MKDNILEPKPRAPAWPWFIILPLVPIVFGILMGIVRERLHSTWWRAAVAAGSFAVLALSVGQLRKLRS